MSPSRRAKLLPPERSRLPGCSTAKLSSSKRRKRWKPEQTYGETAKLSSSKRHKPAKPTSSQRSGTCNLEKSPGGSKDDTTKSSPFIFHKHVLSQKTESSYNLDPLPGCSKDYFPVQTFEETNESSFNPRKCVKHVSSQSSESGGNLDSLPGFSKTAISEKTCEETSDSILNPCKHPKHVPSQSSRSSSNLDLLSDSSKNSVSEPTSSASEEKETKSKGKKRKQTSQGNTDDKKLESIPERSSSQERYIKETWVNDNPLSVNIEDLAEELQDYFKTVVVILYYNMEKEGCVVSNDFQTNQNLIQLIPHFVDFFCKVINEFKNDFLKVSLVFKFTDALLQNPYIYFGQNSYLNILFSGLFKFLNSDLLQFNQDSLDCWAIKDTAENIVSLLLKKSKCNYLYFEAMYLVNLVLTTEASLSSCYGALVILNALGVPAIVDLLPSYIERFYKENETVLSSNRGACLVQGQIFRLYYVLVDYYLKNEVEKLEFKVVHPVRFIFPDYLKDIKVFPVLSNLEKTLSSSAGEVFLPAKIRLLNFVLSHSTNLRRSTKRDVKGEKKLRKKELFTNYSQLMGTII